MHKLTITLKQHTPLIHFQHEQKGATLRASEVKPRLDRFILTQLGGDKGYEEGKKIAKGNGWLIGKGEKPALDYKMRIDAGDLKDVKMKQFPSLDSQKQQKEDDEKNLLFLTKFPFILSNLGGKKKEDLVNFSFSDFSSMIISSSNALILEEIQRYICEFFTFYNWGRSPNKGFGSFTVSMINNNPVTFSDECFPENTHLLEFCLPNNGCNIENIERIFGTIDYYWKRLKSGINYKEELLLMR